MNRNHDTGYGAARQRDHDLMVLLARVVAGEAVLDGDESVEDLRQMGYAASLVRRRVADPWDKLGEFARVCMSRTMRAPKPELSYRDPVQALWGALHGLDARKLRTELPLHMMRLARSAETEPAVFA